ncbi:hypothetical protein [Sphingobacterium sp. LRF_L2]|uniref:hypothetical protein n=1 Tax=Sphingobacterium sp. LRF_L2 TaxID=3369421 RepID=UPI003F60EAF8
MKSIFVLVFISCIIPVLYSQPIDLKGAFTSKEGNTEHLWLFIDGYCSQTTYTEKSYVSTFGGPFTYTNGQLELHVEYADADSNQVGKTYSLPLKAVGNNFEQANGLIWNKVPHHPQELDGTWRISGRKQQDHIESISKGSRKTIKLLVDGYFQWIAINPATKGFYGTGGGKYIFNNGSYKEYLLFFSRDNTRIGSDLTFNGKIENSQWHHSGLSSKGAPIYEIWSRDPY